MKLERDVVLTLSETDQEKLRSTGVTALVGGDVFIVSVAPEEGTNAPYGSVDGNYWSIRLADSSLPANVPADRMSFPRGVNDGKANPFETFSGIAIRSELDS